MVCLLANIKGDSILSDYLKELELEYDFWMNAEGASESHLVSYKGIAINRYYDRNEGPRPEMYATDVADYEKFGKPENYYKHLRAACESGWDFSCRWFKDPMDLGSINTLNILPVDLNCLLLYLERTIARAYEYNDNSQQTEAWNKRASIREEAIQTLFWNPEQKFFNDINYKEDQHTAVLSLAGLFPLFFRCATKKQAKACAKVVEQHFLKEGGLVSTSITTGQQWDAPNGWAPLQYMSVIGLRNYGFDELANKIISRWIQSNRAIYEKTGKMLEKYNVVDTDQLSGGGEYLVQDGFGWTNGVYLAFIRLQKELIRT
jgi:alpha,alpha-trehalase